MSFWTRLKNTARGNRLNRDIDEELQSHVDAAVDAGRDSVEARRGLGSPWTARDASRDVRLLPWLESLRADAAFGLRRLAKRKVTSAAAVLSLALAIGSCTAAFRLIDALLLRPLPVAHAEQLYELTRQGLDDKNQFVTFDGWAYPDFQLMRAAVRDQAELVAVAYAEREDLTYGSQQDMEKAVVQYVSGGMFPIFGLRPATGRLFTENDDVKPGGHPYAVLTHDYWRRRFGADQNVVGRTFHMGDKVYEVAGVVEGPFTGSETGITVDIFLPTMMHPGAVRDDWTWMRTLALVKPGAPVASIEPMRAKLDAVSRAFEMERLKKIAGLSKQNLEKFLAFKVVVEPASSGASNLQKEFRPALIALGILVTLVLTIACVNVANLMTAQAAARAREMALRVSIGAGRGRLVQLVLMESAWLAFFAGAIGAAFAWWAGPFVLSRINPADNPVRLLLPADWRVLMFGTALTAIVTLLFGLLPALRASSVRPSSALKGGDGPHSRRRLMHALIAVQVAFCFLVLFTAGLLAATFQRLNDRPLGFAPQRLLAVDATAVAAQPPAVWEQAVARLRSLPGVESAALAGFTLLHGTAWNGYISVEGAPPSERLAYFLRVSPGWLDTMKIALIDGRDLHPGETGVALINQTLARQFFGTVNPIGRHFTKGRENFEVVGVVHDAPYRRVRESILPSAYVAFSPPERHATLMVRTTGDNPLALASLLREEVSRARAELRVSTVRDQSEIIRNQTLRERLLAMLALFFAAVALLLAGIGLFGVLDYSVLQRRREIGIRVAIGARPASIAGLVTGPIAAMVLTGAAAGLVLGRFTARYLTDLLYNVTADDLAMLALPSMVLLAAALLAALPAVWRATHIDPVEMLRSE